MSITPMDASISLRPLRDAWTASEDTQMSEESAKKLPVQIDSSLI